MILRSADPSPFGRKIRIAAGVLGLDSAMKVEPADTVDPSDSVRRQNPLGKIPVLVHILAPNNRPVQITQDLAGFWREHYPKVKQELQRKYPKHEWR